VTMLPVPVTMTKDAPWRALCGRETTMAADAYCTKCRTKREIKDAKEVTTANGRHALQGACPVCGTKLTRFVAGPAKAAVRS
jgi:hypothetical protein